MSNKYYKYMRYINGGIKVSIKKVDTGYNSTYNPEYRIIDIVFKEENKIYYVRFNQIKPIVSDLTGKLVFCTADDNGDPLSEIYITCTNLPFNTKSLIDLIKEFVSKTYKDKYSIIMNNKGIM